MTIQEATALSGVISSEQPRITGCRHHWIIEPAENPLSQGVCRNCREVRAFKNFMDEASWKGDAGERDGDVRMPMSTVPRLSDEQEEPWRHG